MDPIVTNDEKVEKNYQLVHKTIKEIDEILDIHDFRMVEGPIHTNFIFDVVIPHKYRMTEKELITEINDRIHTINENFNLVITVDNCYI